MQLSETDKKLVERLKKRQRQLIRWRWVGLIAALISIGVGFYAYQVLVHVTTHFIQHPDDIVSSVLCLAYVFPVFLILQFGGFGLLIYLSAVWRGKPETNLLLRLIEDSQHDA